jgi:hypothetical protein
VADKNIDDIFEKMFEARDQYHPRITDIPGVFGTSIGVRQTAGKFTTEPAIIFHVENKRALQEIPANERIPREVDGFPTDVVGNEPLLGATAAQVEDQEKYRPIMGGCQITEGKGRSNNKGTLGCAVRFIGEDRHDGLKKGNIYVLSASHVMLDVGNAIYQPWDRSSRIGEVQASELTDYVDAAIADISYYDDGAVPEIIGIGAVTGSHNVTVSDAALGTYQVKKRGRTTGLTTGTISSIGFNGSTPRPGQEKRAFMNLMTIVGYDKEGKKIPFGNSGDSGAVVLNSKNEVVGLLTSVFIGGTDSVAFAIPIKTILDKLQIQILV